MSVKTIGRSVVVVPPPETTLATQLRGLPAGVNVAGVGMMDEIGPTNVVPPAVLLPVPLPIEAPFRISSQEVVQPTV
jgi:hypothetical protein